MPIIKRQEIASTQSSTPGLENVRLIDAEHGSESLRVGESTLAPGTRIPTHIHPNTEEAVVVLEGAVEVVLGNQRMTLAPGRLDVAARRNKTRHPESFRATGQADFHLPNS